MSSTEPTSPLPTIFRREIKSFVRREGRITQAQLDAIESLWPKYGVEKNELKNLDQIFDRKAPLFIEIGCGIGDAILSLAKNNPDNNYIGIEVYLPGLGSILQGIEENNLSNVRLVRDDAMECLRETIPDQSLDGMMIFFPDPWPKTRHKKRRIIQPKSLSLIKTKLKKHGRLFVATDWQEYANHIIRITKDSEDMINLAGSKLYAPRPVWRPLTRYEKRGLRLGHKVRDFVFTPRQNLSM